MIRQELNICPFTPKQMSVLTWWMDSTYKDYDGIIADGAIRSGKTMTMSLSFVMWAMTTFNGMNFAICGKTIGSCRRNVITPLERMLEQRAGYKVKDSRSINCLTITFNGHQNDFYLFGGTDERSQDSIQGITLAGVLLDEVALMPESFVNQATARCSVEGAKHWYNCNPAGSRLHWFKQLYINLYKEKRYLYLHFTMDDNPSLSERTKNRYRAQYVGAFYRRYIEGRWVSAEGIIYDMWAEQNIFDENEYPENHLFQGARYVGVDYGTTNPMVFLYTVDDGYNLLITKEYYYNSRATTSQAQKTDAMYADDFEEFVQHDHSVNVIIDPSAESFRVELRNRGYRVINADNEVNDGIRVTSTMIQKRRLRVLRHKTPNLIHEIESYIWDEKAVLRGEEKPVKENDHAMDAMRYLCKTLITRRRL